jgi:SAM-dependent methyltransferase
MVHRACVCVQDRGAMCAGVDFSSSMLQLAQANIDAFAAAKAKGEDDSAELPAVMLLPGDAHALPFQQSAVDEAGGLFDAVVCNFGVLHLGEPEKFFSEAFRLLRPGGKFGFTVWCAPPETEGFAITLVGTVPCPALPACLCRARRSCCCCSLISSFSRTFVPAIIVDSLI